MMFYILLSKFFFTFLFVWLLASFKSAFIFSFFFLFIYFIIICPGSGMFRNVPGCSMFRILLTLLEPFAPSCLF